MFVEQLRRGVEASPRAELPAVSALLWKAFAAGQVTEQQASELSEMIELDERFQPLRSPYSGVSARGHEQTPAWSAAAAGPPLGLYRPRLPAGSRWPSRPC